MKCLNCNTEMKWRQRCCIECGIPRIDVIICPICKVTVEKEQKFCGVCGTYLIIKTPVTNNIKGG